MSMVVRTRADETRERRLELLAELLEVEGLDAAAAIARADNRAVGYIARPVSEEERAQWRDNLEALAADVDVILLGDVAEHLTGGALRRVAIRGRERHRG